MKNVQKLLITAIVLFGIDVHALFAQTPNEERMRRDIEVAENVLATLIKQGMEHQKVFFGVDVKGTYQPGYGVTFRVPAGGNMPFVTFTPHGTGEIQGATVISDGSTYRYSYRSTNGNTEEEVSDNVNKIKLKDRTTISSDSLRAAYNDRIIQAAQSFILEYGDFLTQLSPNERIVVTNRNDQANYYPFNVGKRTRISVEGVRSDITAFRQGKLSRDEAVKKLTVINTESVETKEPDMEMLSSIFSRLYRPDLSKTYFLEGNVYYERLRDFGSIFYMRVVSSDESLPGHFNMPTLGLRDLDQAARDKKVKELYPAFERDLKENILDYGRTVKSLKDNESLIFNIQMTRCPGCGIPGTLELSVKSSVLKDFDAGRIDKNAANSKIEVKKGTNQ